MRIRANLCKPARGLYLVSTVDLFNVHGTVHREMCVLYNQRDATYVMFFIIINALHV